MLHHSLPKITYVLFFIPYVHIIGIFKIKNTIKTCGGIPITLALDLFDKIVLPILIYGAEIWGTKYAGPIEVVHIKYCEYILQFQFRLIRQILQLWVN